MATVRQLAISGIRSFGADEKDQQLIVFQRPLTLILGENGCGKTTLVEALKFALCDDLPPNSDHGRSFVHDPKISNTREIKGQVRLEFTDIKKSKYLVSRTVQAQMKLKKMQFQRLENFIKTVDEQGKQVEISGRCGDTNNTIASILGVSKAILNNVIFCHQEDSNWPLDEGKKLKERFDAIFEATKYNKCLEHIRKMTKEYANDIKLSEQKVMFLTEKKEELEKKKLKLYADEEKINAVQELLIKLNDQLEPIQKRLQEINKVENNLVRYKTKRETTKARIETCLTQQKDLKNNINKLYNGSDEDLKNEIELFTSNLSKKEKDLEKSNKNLESLKRKEIDVNRKISSNDVKKSELFTLEGQNQKKVHARNKELLKVADFAEVEKPAEIEDEDEASSVLSVIKNKLTEKQKEFTECNANVNKQEKSLQKTVDGCRDDLTRHREIITSKQKEQDRLNSQSSKLKKDIQEANETKAKLESIREKMEESDRNLQIISEECDVNDCQKSINKDELEIATLEAELDEIDKMISSIQTQQAKRTEIGVQKETLSTKQKTFNRIRNKNKDAMIELLNDKIPENNFKRTFQNCMNTIKNEVDELNKQLKLKQHEVTSLESNRVHEKNELDKKKKELTLAEEQIYKYCKTQSLDDVLSKLDSEISKLQDQKAELSSSEIVIKKFVDKLEDTDPCCPLCHRGFDNQQEVSDLVTELQDKVQNVPKNLESVIKRLSKQVAERDQLISLRPLSKKINTLKDDEIPMLEKKLENTDKMLEDARNTVEDCTLSLADPENKLSVVESMLSDMPLLDQLVHEISSVTSEIAKLEAQLGNTNFDMSLEEATVKQGETKQEISRLRLLIKSNQTKLNQHNHKLNSAREKKNKLKEQFLQAQAKIQELCTLQTRYDEITESKKRLDKEIEELNEKTTHFRDELSMAEKKKISVMETMRKQVDDLRKYESQLDKMISAVIRLNNEIERHNAKNIPGELKKLKALLESLYEEQEELMSEIKNETSNITQIKDDISNQMINKRELDDNMNLRKFEKEQKQLESEIQEIEEKLGELNSTTLLNEKKKLITSENNTIVEKARKEGELKQLQESVDQTKLELKQKQYKNVEDEYRSQFYALELLKIAVKDIKDYAFAMDCCLMKYHKDKMEKINYIIRDLWRNIYRGNDIDYIEIKTDESSAKTGAVNRRVYDYRVVQRRNDVEIDMRGRCSAGQKVLASLIIRMALAETFSNRFGVLALDEPTTNLDRENVMSLCNALKDMVLTRMKNNNFLFIIITHDAEFLKSLGGIDKLNHYYKVTRNRDGKSRIIKEKMP